MDLAISADNISKIYHIYDENRDRLKEAFSITRKQYHRDFYALKNISFQIRRGQCVGFIGINGSGKSTLLKILTGVLTPSGGNFQINGKVSALLELGAGFNLEYTGMENIYLNGAIMGFSHEEMEERVGAIIEFANIGDFIYQPVKVYSSGMFVRLAFAVAINVDPEILIIDEALSVGDVFFQLKCYKKFQDFLDHGKTIIFVSHDLNSIIKYCDTAYLLSHGEIIDNGSPRQVVDTYKKELSYRDSGIQQSKPMVAAQEGILWKSMLQINEKMLEYGNRKSSITDFAILDDAGKITATISKGQRFHIKMRVTFSQDVEAPIFAYTIKDVKGMELTGTNSTMENIETGIISAGEILEITFTQFMQLQGGPYLLSLGCTKIASDGSVEVMHRLYDVVEIQLVHEKLCTGFFDLNSEIRIENIK